MSNSTRCKSRRRQKAKVLRQDNGLKVEIKAKEKVEHAVMDEARK